MGFAASHMTWAPQLAELVTGACLACPDNRGVGQSGCPDGRRHYSTSRMALDCLGVLDALGWREAHVIGHSMGAMVACKFAAMFPQRARSLTVICGTGGGWESVPLAPRPLWLGLQLLFSRSAARRAAVDVQFHYSPATLRHKESAHAATQHERLLEEYIAAAAGGDSAQPLHGMRVGGWRAWADCG